MIKKVCKDCGLEKKLKDFYPTQGECKECSKKRIRENWNDKREYYRSYDVIRQRENFDRIFKHRFYNMRAKVNGYAIRKYKIEGLKMFSKKEFLNWCYNKNNIEIFKNIHKRWKKNNFSRRLSPSIDRINNNKGYTIDNIQWITQCENCKKYNK